MRDRVLVIGSAAETPVEVDSVDEVIFMVRRERILARPLTEEPDLAWHAYAVEYGLQMRRLGLGVGAVDLAVTHNSLTINLQRLDVAHRKVASMHPDQLPVRTTCGTVGPRLSGWKGAPVIRDHRWRVRWLARSLRAYRAGHSLHTPVVLGDIRTDVDLFASSDEAMPLIVINLDRGNGFRPYAREPVRLTRAGAPVVFRVAASIDEVLATITALSPSQSVLVANLSIDDLPELDGRLPREVDWMLGLQDETTWLVGGPVLRDLPAEWSEPKAVPLGEDRRRRRQKTSV